MANVSKIVMWRTETRPNAGVEFWHQNPEEQAYLENTYKTPGLLISDESIISEDQLTKTRTQTWARVPGIVTTIREDAELINQSNLNIAYNQTHGITRSAMQYKIIDANGVILVHGEITD